MNCWKYRHMFHSREWTPAALFQSVSRTAFASPGEKERRRRYENLWPGACTESDAAALGAEIHRRGILVTEDARRFIELWGRDELRHADGFILLLEILCGLRPEDVRAELASRTHDFSLITPHVVDELSLLAVIAFDELATCRGYSREHRFYEELGHPAFLEWIKAIISDEMTHATNAIRVIHRHHAHRIVEVNSILAAWMDSSSSHNEYRGTFLMDNLDNGYFRDDFPAIMANLNRLLANPALLDQASGKTVVL